MTLQEEKILIIRLKSGDKDAFRQLFEHYYPLFISFAQNMLKDAYVAEDLIQNVFMRLWILRERLDSEKGLRNYLLVAVRNEVYCHYRNLFLDRREDITGDFEDKAPDSDAILSVKELRSRIEEVVSEMPFRRKEVFNLSRKSSLTNAEIAARLGLSVRTVEKHLEMALRDIRKKLAVPVLLLISIL